VWRTKEAHNPATHDPQEKFTFLIGGVILLIAIVKFFA
jgi:hypothetical protein